MSQRVNSDIYLLDKVSPLFPIARLCGVLPYSDGFSFSDQWFKYSIVFVSLVAAGVNSFRGVYLFYSSSSFLNEGFNTVLYIFQSSLNDICLLAHLFQLILKRKKLRKTFDLLKKFDAACTTEYTATVAKKLTGFGLFWISLSQAAVLVTDSTTYEKLVRITYSTTYVIFYTIVMIFCSLLELVRNHFTALIQDMKPVQSKLHNQINMHYSLINLGFVINQFFSLQLLIICMRCSLNFICQMFFFLQYLRNTNWAMDVVLSLVFLIGDCIMELLILFFIAGSCSETAVKATNFCDELFRMMSKNTELFDSNELQLYVTINKTVEFTASGFFTVGYPLVTSVMAAATTYLVILIQFSMVSGASKFSPESTNVTHY